MAFELNCLTDGEKTVWVKIDPFPFNNYDIYRSLDEMPPEFRKKADKVKLVQVDRPTAAMNFVYDIFYPGACFCEMYRDDCPMQISDEKCWVIKSRMLDE